MICANAIRLLAATAVLAATACAPVFATNDHAGLAPVSFGQSTTQPTVIGQR